MDKWDIFRTVLQPIIAAILGLMAYVFRAQSQRIDELEKRITAMEQSDAVLDTKIDNILDDIKEIKEYVKELLIKNNEI